MTDLVLVWDLPKQSDIQVFIISVMYECCDWVLYSLFELGRLCLCDQSVA